MNQIDVYKYFSLVNACIERRYSKAIGRIMHFCLRNPVDAGQILGNAGKVPMVMDRDTSLEKKRRKPFFPARLFLDT